MFVFDHQKPVTGSGSGFKKYIYLKPVMRIRIRIDFGLLDPDPGTHWDVQIRIQKGKKIEKSEEISCFEVLKASPVAWSTLWRPRDM